MHTVQINVYDRAGSLLFFTLGLGVNVAAARASARIGMRARLSGDRALERDAYVIEAEEI